jgi:hypothetical protein
MTLTKSNLINTLNNLNEILFNCFHWTNEQQKWNFWYKNSCPHMCLYWTDVCILKRLPTNSSAHVIMWCSQFETLQLLVLVFISRVLWIVCDNFDEVFHLLFWFFLDIFPTIYFDLNLVIVFVIFVVSWEIWGQISMNLESDLLLPLLIWVTSFQVLRHLFKFIMSCYKINGRGKWWSCTKDPTTTRSWLKLSTISTFRRYMLNKIRFSSSLTKPFETFLVCSESFFECTFLFYWKWSSKLNSFNEVSTKMWTFEFW